MTRARNYALVAAAATSFSLGGCVTTGDVGQNITDFIKQAQQKAVEYCNYLPIADTIEAIAKNGVVTTVDGIAHAICAAVAPPPSTGAQRSKRQGPPMVGNVEVRGQFVK